jgi:uncharacterized membrane protein YczE
MLPIPSADELWRRVPRLLGGLVLFGVGIALMVRADLGLAPWDVLHQGLADRTGLAIGTVTILVGALVLLLWIPLRQRPGLGTLLNVLLVGLSLNASLLVLPDVEPMAARVAFLAAGLLAIAVGSGFYIGAGLGPGPRDGLMVGLSRRGWSVRLARTGVELAALAAGWLLGGTVGVGTVVEAVAIGPMVQVALRVLAVAPLGDLSEAEGTAALHP